MSASKEPPFRADHVGSLLRPAELRQAREDHQAGRITAQQLRAIEDAAIPRVEAFGRKAPSPIVSSDRGGAISIPTQDPLAARENRRPARPSSTR